MIKLIIESFINLDFFNSEMEFINEYLDTLGAKNNLLTKATHENIVHLVPLQSYPWPTEGCLIFYGAHYPSIDEVSIAINGKLRACFINGKIKIRPIFNNGAPRFFVIKENQ